jgi:hypothetical protein
MKNNMELKSTYKLSYTLNKEPKDLVLTIELKQVEGLLKKYRNVWEGTATLNGQPYTEVNLSHCVNAKPAVERIGKMLRDELIYNAQSQGQKFKVKKEEIK